MTSALYDLNFFSKYFEHLSQASELITLGPNATCLSTKKYALSLLKTGVGFLFVVICLLDSLTLLVHEKRLIIIIKKISALIYN